ncbi:MAG TPA: hypothetical protein PLJ78_04010 [Anaerolineae bacterium]|nr:hypothetical protein [Anaerolineae bacterium]HQK13095.1 hypothetical protein [Anaerolineae bacterium]
MCRRTSVSDHRGCAKRVGLQLQVTNAPEARLTLPQATAAYRDEWHLDHDFHRLKDRPVGLSPLFAWRDDQIRGLTRLLALALRLLTLLETQVAQGLAADAQRLSSLYEGQPQRTTARPSIDIFTFMPIILSKSA